LADGVRPALVRGAVGGAAIEVEVWRLPVAEFGGFVAGIPAPLGIGKVELEDGTWCCGFICEPVALDGAIEITHLGGWRRYIEER
jgi:allophanate hydrolase